MVDRRYIQLAMGYTKRFLETGEDQYLRELQGVIAWMENDVNSDNKDICIVLSTLLGKIEEHIAKISKPILDIWILLSDEQESRKRFLPSALFDGFAIRLNGKKEASRQQIRATVRDFARSIAQDYPDVSQKLIGEAEQDEKIAEIDTRLIETLFLLRGILNSGNVNNRRDHHSMFEQIHGIPNFVDTLRLSKRRRIYIAIPGLLNRLSSHQVFFMTDYLSNVRTWRERCNQGTQIWYFIVKTIGFLSGEKLDPTNVFPDIPIQEKTDMLEPTKFGIKSFYRDEKCGKRITGNREIVALLSYGSVLDSVSRILQICQTASKDQRWIGYYYDGNDKKEVSFLDFYNRQFNKYLRGLKKVNSSIGKTVESISEKAKEDPNLWINPLQELVAQIRSSQEKIIFEAADALATILESRIKELGQQRIEEHDQLKKIVQIQLDKLRAGTAGLIRIALKITEKEKRLALNQLEEIRTGYNGLLNKKSLDVIKNNNTGKIVYFRDFTAFREKEIRSLDTKTGVRERLGSFIRSVLEKASSVNNHEFELTVQYETFPFFARLMDVVISCEDSESSLEFLREDDREAMKRFLYEMLEVMRVYAKVYQYASEIQKFFEFKTAA